jgi:hypothetical protein
MSTENINFNLNLNADNSLKTVMGMRREMKSLQEEMMKASQIGDKILFEKLKQKFIDLKEASKDFNHSAQALNNRMAAGSRVVGQSVAAFQNLSMVMGANNKSAEELFKTFAKAQAFTQLATQLPMIQKDMWKLVDGVKATGVALKAAFASNPIMVVMMALTAVVGVVGGLIMKYRDAYDAEGAWSIRARKNMENLKKATESYVGFITEYNKKIGEWNDRELTEGEKIKKSMTLQFEQNKQILKDMIIQLRLKEKMLETDIERARAASEILKWTSPDLYKQQSSEIEKLEERKNSLNKSIKQGVKSYQEYEKTGAETIEKIAKGTDELNLLKKEGNEILKERIELNKEYIKIYGERQAILEKGEKVFKNQEIQNKLLSELDNKSLNDKLEILKKREDAEIEYNKTEQQRLEDRFKRGEIGWTEYNDRIIEIENKKNETILNNQIALATNIGMIFSELSNVIGKETYEAAIFSRALTMFQIGIDTAAGISKAVATGAAVGLTPIEKGIAIAGNIAVVMANIAKAKKLLSEPIPAFKYGGVVPGEGNEDSQLIKAMPGEIVINKKASKKFAPILSAINSSTGGVDFSRGDIIDYELLASKINDKKVFVVSKDITNRQSLDNKIMKKATF